MKRISILLLSSLLLVAACKKDDGKKGPATGALRVSVTNTVNDQAIDLGPLNYTNANGDRHSFDMLKYYVSHFTLIRDDSTEVVSPHHNLIDLATPESLSFSLDSIPNGRYIGVRFYLGIDPAHNGSLDNGGDLDPMNGMVWTWETGYIFFKHEGRFIGKDGDNHALVYHLGTDRALTTVTKAVTPFEISGASRTMHLNFDLYRLYGTPTKLDFNIDDVRMSTSQEDVFWRITMQSNIPGAFEVRSVE